MKCIHKIAMLALFCSVLVHTETSLAQESDPRDEFKDYITQARSKALAGLRRLNVPGQTKAKLRKWYMHPEYVPDLDVLAPAKIGRVSLDEQSDPQAYVLSVAGPSELLLDLRGLTIKPAGGLRLESRLESIGYVWVNGINTDKARDDDLVVLRGVFVADGTKTYQSKGGKKTVSCIRKVADLPAEAP